MSQSKYFELNAPDFKDHQDCGPWRSYDLHAEGETLDELIESAVYWQTDQDGGDLGSIEADDNGAVEYIIAWAKEREVPLEHPKNDEGTVKSASYYIARNSFDPEG